jgi:aminoglycoside 3-N-acetyltransferase
MLLAEHPLEDAFGERSPLARLYDRAAMILLLGVGFEVCTAFHLAEHRAHPDLPRIGQGTSLLQDGRRRWVEFQEYPVDDALFPAIGADFSTGGLVTAGHIGGAEARFLPLPEGVDFAADWLRRRGR